MPMRKELKELHEEARQQGFRVEEGAHNVKRCGHPDPTQPMFVSGKSPSDRRAFDNFVRKFRRAGLEWPPKNKKDRRIGRRGKGDASVECACGDGRPGPYQPERDQRSP
jgi:hypothetical protein